MARKRAAELKAQRDPAGQPVRPGSRGAGFESERRRAKTALRDEPIPLTARAYTRSLPMQTKQENAFSTLPHIAACTDDSSRPFHG